MAFSSFNSTTTTNKIKLHHWFRKTPKNNFCLLAGTNSSVSLLTWNLTRVFVVDYILANLWRSGRGSLSSGLCPHTEGGLPPGWLYGTLLASLLADSLPSIAFRATKEKHSPHRGGSASPPRGKCCRQFWGEGAQCSCPSTSPCRQNHRFHLVAEAGKDDAEGM